MAHAIIHPVARCAAALLLAGCATQAHEQAVAPLSGEARAGIGPLSVETAMVEPIVPPSPPPTHDRGRAALNGAGTSVLIGLEAGAGSGNLFVAGLFTALGVAAAPFVAAGAAITAPLATDVPDANTQLRSAILDTRWDQTLKDAVKMALARQGKVVADPPTAETGRLQLTVEGPWLVLDSYSALPTLTVHGELKAGERCLIDRRWRWNGDSNDFADLGEDRAEEYRAQMEKGLTLLAEAVVLDILVAQEARKTAYKEEGGAERGALPLLVTDAMDFQEQVGSWDKTHYEAIHEPRCSGIGPLEPMAPVPPTAEICRGFGCRNV